MSEWVNHLAGADSLIRAFTHSLSDPEAYSGSTTATITRTGSCTWDLEASADDTVGLILFNTGSGKNRTRSEGRFSMPFKLTFTADALAMPGGCPSQP